MWKESNRPLIQACFWIVAIHSPWFYSTKTLAKESGSTNHHSQSPTAEIQVENTHLHNDISPKKTHNIALSSEDSFNHLAPISESSPPVRLQKKVQKKIPWVIWRWWRSSEFSAAKEGQKTSPWIVWRWWCKKTLENANDKAEPDEGGDCIVEVAKKVKPIQHVLFKVRFNYSY